MKKLGAFCSVLAALTVMSSTDVMAATKKTSTTKQSTIQKGTSVRAKVTATGLYDQECYDAFYGCMDQFCISDTSNGGSCACSDASFEYEKQFKAIQDKMIEAERIATEEVERFKPAPMQTSFSRVNVNIMMMVQSLIWVRKNRPRKRNVPICWQCLKQIYMMMKMKVLIFPN